MGQAKSIDKTETTSPTTNPKEANRSLRSKVHIVQNVVLIWLDSSIDASNSDCQNTIINLRDAVNTINIFSNGEECMDFLKDVTDEKACIIISGALGQTMVPQVHNLSQVDSIFIFCRNKEYHEAWANDWSKIKGVFTNIGPICTALKQAARQCEQNAISISIMGGGDGTVEKSGDRLDPSFMYTQIMKEILLTINFEQKHIDEFIEYCQKALADNKKQLEYVNQIARKYHEHTPIWWYTCDCFLYSMLNRALRTMDAGLMIKLGFFIGDLHRHIERLQKEQFSDDSSNQRFTVYRGQGMEKEAFEKLVANKGGLVSFNSFLSTSKDSSISLSFAQGALASPQLVGVLFVMNIELDRSSTPFASVVDNGYFGEKENEVLFSMHTVFRIGEITAISGNPRLVQVELNLASDKDNDLRQLIDHMREETFPDSSGWHRLGQVLCKIGEPDKAQKLYEILLEQETEESVIASIYHQLGLIKRELGEYDEAIEYYKKSIEIKEKKMFLNDLDLSKSYNNIGLVYDSIDDYSNALWFLMKALTIQQRSLSSIHPHLAASQMNIGNVYSNMGDYPNALLSYEKVLEILQQSLPSTHPDLAKPYNNIGMMYDVMGDYSKALLFYEQALTIKQQSLPSTHADLALTYYNIGLVHKNMSDYLKAHSYFEHAVNIGQSSLPANHPYLQKYRHHFANIKKEAVIKVILKK